MQALVREGQDREGREESRGASPRVASVGPSGADPPSDCPSNADPPSASSSTADPLGAVRQVLVCQPLIGERMACVEGHNARWCLFVVQSGNTIRGGMKLPRYKVVWHQLHA